MDALFRLVLAIARLPPEPADPAGAPGSLRVLRAAPRYVAYRFARRWGWLAVFVIVDEKVWAKILRDPFFARVFAAIAILGAIVDTIHLSLELRARSYKLTDRALRTREGLFYVREMTMTFANIQNVSVARGPLQGLFGISDVVIKSAGGGSEGTRDLTAADMHTARFRGLPNAEEIRDVVLARMKAARDAGLGDGDDAAPPASLQPDVAAVLRGVVDDARAFREATERLAENRGMMPRR